MVKERKPAGGSETDAQVAKSLGMLVVLRIVVAVQSVGLAATIHFYSTPVFGVVYFEWGWPEWLATGLDQFATGLLLVIAASALTYPIRAVFFIATLWQLAMAFSTLQRDEGFGDHWAPAAQATRIAAPLALALLLATPTAARLRRVEWLLRIAAALTFLAHGVECIAGNPRFADFLLVAADGVGIPMADASADRLLWGIGAVDVGLALVVLLARSRVVTGYMAFWGWLTAAARILFYGPVGSTEALIRFANGGIPFALLIRYHESKHRTPTEGES